jgi:hypothetical protein
MNKTYFVQVCALVCLVLTSVLIPVIVGLR